jgi:serine acetyltransferase
MKSAIKIASGSAVAAHGVVTRAAVPSCTVTDVSNRSSVSNTGTRTTPQSIVEIAKLR